MYPGLCRPHEQSRLGHVRDESVTRDVSLLPQYEVRPWPRDFDTLNRSIGFCNSKGLHASVLSVRGWDCLVLPASPMILFTELFLIESIILIDCFRLWKGTSIWNFGVWTGAISVDSDRAKLR